MYMPSAPNPGEEADHTECPIELLAFAEHREAQLQERGIFTSSDVPPKEGHAGGHRFTGEDGKPIVGLDSGAVWTFTRWRR